MKALERSFHELKTGMEVSFEVVISEKEILRFADLSGDYNPLHVSEDQKGSVSVNSANISHGMLLASYFSRLVGMYLPGKNSLYLSQSCRFVKPVRTGDSLIVKGTIAGKSLSGRTITLKTQIYNQAKELVVDGTAEVLVREETVIENEEVLKTESPVNLQGKVALVTGASRGIGAAIARLLSQSGASVVLNFHQDERGANKVLSEIQTSKRKGLALKADVSDPQEVQKMVETAQKKLGPVDILINNAAPAFKPVSFASLSWQEIQKHIDVILKGAFLCAKAVVPSMTERKQGKIINILSTYAFGIPPVQLTHYVVAKAALAGFSRSLAAELGPAGIQVNTIAPGMTETSLIDHVPPRFRDLYAYQTPLKRLARPGDPAKAALFLCSDLADFITGATIPVCGGNWMG